MATRQTTIRLAERTDEQLEKLAQLFGDRTKAVTVAIDRMYYREVWQSMSAPEKTVWCAHRIAVLSAVFDAIDSYSPAILLALLHIEEHELKTGVDALFGYDVQYGIANAVAERLHALKNRILAKPRLDDDPAFEIIRHIKNRWYGTRENDSYPNEIAERIMADHPYPHYLP